MNKLFYYLSAFAALLTGCTSDSQKERLDKDSLEQQEMRDTLKIDVPMQAILSESDFFIFI